MKVAVIDLGTNTCNLLIAEAEKPGYKILHRSKQVVRLGDKTIKNNLISNEAAERVLHALSAQNGIIRKSGVQKVFATATSAVRDAVNKTEFLKQIASKTGLNVKIVSGEEEAELIFKGVLLAMTTLENPTLILDIGGGSNELIIAQNTEMLWKESQPTGMSRVIGGFALSDPLKPAEIKLLENFFESRHREAFEKCRLHGVKTLIGCSGAFDTIADITDQVNPGEKHRVKQNITLKNFNEVFRLIARSTHAQRLKITGMDMVRVDLIVPAMVFIAHIVEKTGIKEIIQTDFALREGVFYNFLNSPDAQDKTFI